MLFLLLQAFIIFVKILKSLRWVKSFKIEVKSEIMGMMGHKSDKTAKRTRTIE